LLPEVDKNLTKLSALPLYLLLTPVQ
jgi:hypothetical protein